MSCEKAHPAVFRFGKRDSLLAKIKENFLVLFSKESIDLGQADTSLKTIESTYLLDDLQRAGETNSRLQLAPDNARKEF